MNPAAKSFYTSSLMALRFSSSNRRRRCFTGLEPAWTSKACSATSLGMPGMSEGLHANILAFARRKSTSTASYLLSRVALTLNVRPLGQLGSTGTSLMAFSLRHLKAIFKSLTRSSAFLDLTTMSST